VTPPDPVSATVEDLTAIDAGGNRLVYGSASTMPGAPAGDLRASNLALRDPSGWRTQPLGAPYGVVPRFSFKVGFGMEVPAMSSDLTSFIFSSGVPLLPTGPAEPRLGIYRAQASGALALIADMGEEGSVRGVSADASHVIFGTVEHLLPGDAGRTTGESIYESVGATLRQVDVATDGSLLSECGSLVPNGAVSASGDRVFFENPVSCEAPSRVYLRESGSKTVEVSASSCSRPDCNGPAPASFEGATPSGAVAFVVTAQQLTNADENDRRDLYRFDSATGSISLVSPGSAAMEGEVEASKVLTATNGSRVYFKANGRLLPGEGAENGTNLYLSDGSGLRLVASIGPKDPIEVSADGGTAVISTATQLVGADTDEQTDVYLYRADTDSLTRLSTGPDGGNAPLGASADPVAAPGTSDGFARHALLATGPFGRAMTADGSRVFFSTAEQLVADDHNQVADLYEWHGGALGLVSSGVGSDPSELATTTPDGGTVVFRTAASLVSSDRDGGDLDLYAARVGGGFEEAQPSAATCTRCAEAGRLARPALVSTQSRPIGRRGQIRLRRLGRKVGRHIAAGGDLVLGVSVPSPGRVSAKAHGRLGGKPGILASGVGGAARRGELQLRLVVKPEARQELIRRRVLRLRLVLRQASLRLARTVFVKLSDPR
jgi:hypothetical protein